jgi:hypothetical protein
MSAVNQDAKLNAPGTAQIEQAVHGRADRAASVENVVHNHQFAIVHREVYLSGLDHRLLADCRKVIAVESDIESADRNVRVREAPNLLGQALGKRNAPPSNTDQGEVFGSAALFDDFVRQPAKRPANFFRREQLSFFYDAHFVAHPNTECSGFAAAESLGEMRPGARKS